MRRLQPCGAGGGGRAAYSRAGLAGEQVGTGWQTGPRARRRGWAALARWSNAPTSRYAMAVHEQVLRRLVSTSASSAPWSSASSRHAHRSQEGRGGGTLAGARRGGARWSRGSYRAGKKRPDGGRVTSPHWQWGLKGDLGAHLKSRVELFFFSFLGTRVRLELLYHTPRVCTRVPRENVFLVNVKTLPS